MALYPGAVYKPTSWGGEVPRNKQGRGILHVAVSTAKSLPPSSGNTWHFYIAKAAPDGSTDGSGGPAYCEQYIDTEHRAATSADANDDAIGIETAGAAGPRGPMTSRELNAEPWTRAQVLRLADIMRWEAAQPGGAPLEVMPDARPGRRGWGPHRLGIKHSGGPRPGWWQPGSEVWSSVLGKECPGDAKVAQIPGIVEEARTGSTEDEDDMNDADWDRMETLTGLRRNQLAQHVTGQVNLVTGRVAALEEVVKQLAAKQGGSIDLDAVRAAAAAGVGEAIANIDSDVTVRFESGPAT